MEEETLSQFDLFNFHQKNEENEKEEERRSLLIGGEAS
jgi:hypothetical protein